MMAMEVHADRLMLEEVSADALLVGVFEDDCHPSLYFSRTDHPLAVQLSELVAAKEITGKRGEATLVHTFGMIAAKRLLTMGLGKREDLNLERLRRMAAVCGRQLRDIHCQRIAIHLGFLPDDFQKSDTAAAMVEGFLLGQYQFTKYRQEQNQAEIQSFGLYFSIEIDEREMARAIRFGIILALATNFTRDLCNEPGNVLTPEGFAETSRQLAAGCGLRCGVLDEQALADKGMNLLLAVGKGSAVPPRLIWLEYRGAGNGSPVYGLLGKGITFDAGGLSLKDQASISNMHLDKTAGAMVLGVIRALIALNARVNVTGVISAAENMPDGRAYRPGDVIRSYAGRTVEISDTDAEGRLVMADALTFMQNDLNIKRIIDVATLTGGAEAAFGPDIIPVMTNTQQMADQFIHACAHSGEPAWELPLYKEYREMLDSQIADIVNDVADGPSTIVSALFLNEFIEPGTEWLHLDIAGKEMTEKEKGYIPKGATGVGLRSLIRYFLHLAGDDIVANGRPRQKLLA